MPFFLEEKIARAIADSHTLTDKIATALLRRVALKGRDDGLFFSGAQAEHVSLTYKGVHIECRRTRDGWFSATAFAGLYGW